MSRYEDFVINVFYPVAGWYRLAIYEYRLLKHAVASGLVEFTGTMGSDGRPAWKTTSGGRAAARLIISLMEAGGEAQQGAAAVSVLVGGHDLLAAPDLVSYLREAILGGDPYLPELLPSKLAKKILRLGDVRWKRALKAGDLGREVVGRRREKHVSTIIVRGLLVTAEACRKEAVELHKAIMRGRYHTQRQGVAF